MSTRTYFKKSIVNTKANNNQLNSFLVNRIVFVMKYSKHLTISFNSCHDEEIHILCYLFLFFSLTVRSLHLSFLPPFLFLPILFLKPFSFQKMMCLSRLYYPRVSFQGRKRGMTNDIHYEKRAVGTKHCWESLLRRCVFKYKISRIS